MIGTTRNPADIISIRGTSPAQLLTAELWWKGSSWLFQDSTNWDVKILPADEEIPEQRKITTMITSNELIILELFDKCSTFIILIRVHGYILRFINNVRHDKIKLMGTLSSEEINTAIRSIVKRIQSSAFSDDFECLHNCQQLPRSSKLLPLVPIFWMNRRSYVWVADFSIQAYLMQQGIQ